MNSRREALIADLIKETGLPDGEIRRFLNALTGKMNEEFQASAQFDLPGVGMLMRIPEIATGTEPEGGAVVAEIESTRGRHASGVGSDAFRIPVPRQSATGHPPAIAEVAEDAEVPRRGRDL